MAKAILGISSSVHAVAIFPPKLRRVRRMIFFINHGHKPKSIPLIVIVYTRSIDFRRRWHSIKVAAIAAWTSRRYYIAGVKYSAH